MDALIGYKVLGEGPRHVLALHDWFSGCSSYDSLIPYLDLEASTYAFIDLRGYGMSKSYSGQFNLQEAADDVVRVLDHLEWDPCHIISHSMSAMLAQWLDATYSTRFTSIVALTPVPATGTNPPDDVFSFLEKAADSDDTGAIAAFQSLTAGRYSDSFYKAKLGQWRGSSTSAARCGYLKMFSKTDFSSKVTGSTTPYLVVVGEHDADAHQVPAMEKTFLKWFPRATLSVCPQAGHFILQEAPVWVFSEIDKYQAMIETST